MFSGTVPDEFIHILQEDYFCKNKGHIQKNGPSGYKNVLVIAG